MSLINKLKRDGERTDPWGTPAWQEAVDESKSGSFYLLCSIPQKAADPLPETFVNVERGKFSQKYVVVDIAERLAKVQEDGVNILTGSRGVVG